MSRIFASIIVGALFGFGLSLSEMVNPTRVVGFLDVVGHWDATLLFVMVGALSVTIPLYPVVLRRGRPVLAEKFVLPTKSAIDRSLVWGAAIFGVGWGLGGLCPGPALAGLATGNPDIFLFVTAMIAGQWLAGRFGYR